MKIEIFLQYFPFSYSASDLALLSVAVKRIPDDSDSFLELLQDCPYTYCELYKEVQDMLCGLGNLKPYPLRGIVSYLRPPDSIKQLRVRAYFTLSTVDIELARFRSACADYKAKVTTSVPEFNMYNYVVSETIAPPLPALEPVHGPYDNSQYDNSNFVDQYDRKVHLQRVEDIKNILFNVSGTVVSLGDGFGTCFEACRLLQEQGHNIKCRAFDQSQTMIDRAKLYGNIVSLGDFSTPIADDEILFLSHVSDYYPDTFLDEHINNKIISFERSTFYKGCYILKPYKKEWGYQLATRGVDLHGIVLTCVMQELAPIDYTMYSLAQELSVREICVMPDSPQYYVGVKNINKLLKESKVHKRSTDLAFISNKMQETSFQGVPYFGVITNQTASRLGGLTTGTLLSYFKRFGGYFSQYPRFVCRVFATTSSSVYSLTTNLHALDTFKTGDFTVCHVPRGIGSVVIRECICNNLAKHDHVLFVCSKSSVVVRNLDYDVRLAGYLINDISRRMRFYSGYCGPGNKELYYNCHVLSRESETFISN